MNKHRKSIYCIKAFHQFKEGDKLPPMLEGENMELIALGLAQKTKPKKAKKDADSIEDKDGNTSTDASED